MENTSNVSGKEIAQVYITDVESSLPRAVKELKGFVKVFLTPGESKEVRVELDREAFGFYDDRRERWVAEKGVFNILVGTSSVDLRLKEEVVLKETVVWTGL